MRTALVAAILMVVAEAWTDGKSPIQRRGPEPVPRIASALAMVDAVLETLPAAGLSIDDLVGMSLDGSSVRIRIATIDESRTKAFRRAIYRHTQVLRRLRAPPDRRARVLLTRERDDEATEIEILLPSPFDGEAVPRVGVDPPLARALAEAVEAAETRQLWSLRNPPAMGPHYAARGIRVFTRRLSFASIRPAALRALIAPFEAAGLSIANLYVRQIERRGEARLVVELWLGHVERLLPTPS